MKTTQVIVADRNSPRSLLALDLTVSSALFEAGRRVPRFLFKLLEYSGDGLIWLAITFASLATQGGPVGRHLWANFLVGLVLDLIETGAVKGLIRRPRPHHNLIAKDMTVIVAVDHFSFPSGHSSRVSFVALYLAVVALGQHETTAMAAAAAWAATVAFSRCVMGRHYLSDVVAGLLLGVVTLAILTKGEFSRAGLLMPQPVVEDLAGKIGGWLQRVPASRGQQLLHDG